MSASQSRIPRVGFRPSLPPVLVGLQCSQRRKGESQVKQPSTPRSLIPLPSPTPVTTPKAKVGRLMLRHAKAPALKSSEECVSRTPPQGRLDPRLVPAKSPTKQVHGLITPASTISRRSSIYPAPVVLPSPHKDARRDAQTKPSSSHPESLAKLTTPPRSPYMHVHIGDPCLEGSLIHHLTCGHKVITQGPEACASNCQGLSAMPRAFPDLSPSKHSDEPFLCAACVEEHVQQHREAKSLFFAEHLRLTALRMGSLPQDWVQKQLDYWERVWTNDVEKEKAEFARLGRTCSYIDVGDPLSRRSMKPISPVSVRIPSWPRRLRPRSRISRSDLISSGGSVADTGSTSSLEINVSDMPRTQPRCSLYSA